MGTAARDAGASRAAVSKESRLVARGAGFYRAVSCCFRFIRPIAVPTDPGATLPECKAVSGSFAVQIRPIVVPTGRLRTEPDNTNSPRARPMIAPLGRPLPARMPRQTAWPAPVPRSSPAARRLLAAIFTFAATVHHHRRADPGQSARHRPSRKPTPSPEGPSRERPPRRRRPGRTPSRSAGFVQRELQEGAPVTERTEVRILTDGEALYVGAWLYDRDPSRIVPGEKVRDVDAHEQRLLRDHPRHVPRSPERLRLRDDAGRRRVRRSGREGRRRRRRARRPGRRARNPARWAAST